MSERLSDKDLDLIGLRFPTHFGVPETSVLVQRVLSELRERRAQDQADDAVARLLLKRVRAFVDKHRLSEPAVLAQSDRAQEALIDFVNSCVRIAGWHNRKED